jgi:hypothetical protein
MRWPCTDETEMPDLGRDLPIGRHDRGKSSIQLALHGRFFSSHLASPSTPVTASWNIELCRKRPFFTGR